MRITDFSTLVPGTNYLIKYRDPTKFRGVHYSIDYLSTFIGPTTTSPYYSQFKILYEKKPGQNKNEPYRKWTRFTDDKNIRNVYNINKDNSTMIFDLGPNGKYITETTSPESVPEFLFILNELADDKLNQDVMSNVKEFLGGRKKSRRNKSKKLRKSKRRRH